MYDRAFLDKHKGRIPLAHRLKSRVVVRENGCHEFQGGKDSSGYGRIKVGPANIGAHKISYLINIGDFDQVNLEIMHICDNPSCVNPLHLVVASHLENMHDAMRKGRHSCQQKYPGVDYGAGLSPRQQAMLDGSKTYRGSLCKKHGVSERKTCNGSCVECYEDYLARKKQRRALVDIF